MTRMQDDSAQQGANCLNCLYFRLQDKWNGNCHRYPPTFAGDTSPIESHRWKFPVVNGRTWCGEHRGPRKRTFAIVSSGRLR